MVFISSRSNLPMSKLDQIYHHLDLIIGTHLGRVLLVTFFVWPSQFNLLTTLCFLHFKKFVSIINFGDGWKKLTDLVSYCEVVFESILQMLFQFSIIAYLIQKRSHTSAQFQSVLMSFFSILFFLVKTSMPAKIINANCSAVEKAKKILWFVHMHYMLFFYFLLVISTFCLPFGSLKLIYI